jgi:serine/threonine protein kinase
MAVVKISYSDLEFGETVGGGAFGTVYKGRWKSRGLEVAIKRATNVVKKEEVSNLV